MKYWNAPAYLMEPFNSHRNPMFRFCIERGFLCTQPRIDICATRAYLLLTFARTPGWTRTNGCSFSAMSLRISSIVRAPIIYLSCEFIWSLRATRMLQMHVYGESICSADTRLLSCLRSACKREYGLIAFLRYKRTFTANLSCSFSYIHFKRIFTTSTCSYLPLSKSIRSLHKHIFIYRGKVAYSRPNNYEVNWTTYVSTQR